MDFIPVNGRPLLDGNEKKYLTECIDTGWISSEGPFVQKFEEGMASSVLAASSAFRSAMVRWPWMWR